jgi:hypothetical protein
MRINQVRQLLEQWQTRLGLGVWRITVKWVALENEHGNVEFDVLHRIATVGINKPKLLPQPITVEYVLVHELLHLVLIELELVEKAKTDQKDMVLERVVNQLTIALLERKQ